MEIVKLLSGQMQELSPFVRVVFVQLHLGLVGLALLGIAIGGGLGSSRAIDQLEDLYVSTIDLTGTACESRSVATVPLR